MTTPHKWQKEIVAWAGGAEIEGRRLGGAWTPCNDPAWNCLSEYRVTPPPPKEPAWTRETCPVGAHVKYGDGSVSLIIGANERHFFTSFGVIAYNESMGFKYQWRLLGGLDWQSVP
jgi:hypothetical protein